MPTSPLAAPHRPAHRRARILLPGLEDRDLLPWLALLWVVSAVRVVGAIVRSEVFGAEATLALAAVVCVPWLLLRSERSRSGGDATTR